MFFCSLLNPFRIQIVLLILSCTYWSIRNNFRVWICGPVENFEGDTLSRIHLACLRSALVQVLTGLLPPSVFHCRCSVPWLCRMWGYTYCVTGQTPTEGGGGTNHREWLFCVGVDFFQAKENETLKMRNVLGRCYILFRMNFKTSVCRFSNY